MKNNEDKLHKSQFGISRCQKKPEFKSAGPVCGQAAPYIH